MYVLTEQTTIADKLSLHVRWNPHVKIVRTNRTILRIEHQSRSISRPMLTIGEFTTGKLKHNIRCSFSFKITSIMDIQNVSGL